jgi:hypothetical protein
LRASLIEMTVIRIQEADGAEGRSRQSPRFFSHRAGLFAAWMQRSKALEYALKSAISTGRTQKPAGYIIKS